MGTVLLAKISQKFAMGTVLLAKKSAKNLPPEPSPWQIPLSQSGIIEYDIRGSF